MNHTSNDISGDICDLYPNTGSCPMYSFSRPAYVFWQGFYDALIGRGIPHEDVMKILQSKGVRHMLDGREEEIEELGRKMGESFSI